jgi:Cu/Ag efflux protein CusF
MLTMPRRTTLVCAMAAGILGFTCVAHAETQTIAGTAVSHELKGTVTFVNVDKRMLTIKTPEGRFEVLHVPKEVQRLDEIKIGNALTITETELVLVGLQKGADAGSAGVTRESSVVRDAGEKPAGMMVESLTVTGVITAVDKAHSTVTVKGPEKSMTFKVEDPALLKSVAPGDSVSASYMRGISGKVKFQ